MSPENCSYFTRIPDMNEIYEALRTMPITAATGPDGFSIFFYLAAWEVIRDDPFSLLKYFYVGGLMHRSVSAYMICLIPNVEHPVSFTQ